VYADGEDARAANYATPGAPLADCGADYFGGGISRDWRAGSLAFPLPALIWCAVRYSLPATCLLTFVTGATEIILVANSIINIAVATPLSTPMMFSARLGIATMAICPVMVSVSVAAINSLIRQVSLRADYDFLTHVYSRSGLYEALKQEESHRFSRFLTVMLLDIDYFKSINDNYGHECGDRVLAVLPNRFSRLSVRTGWWHEWGAKSLP
jgi:predicted signal transduction protein with EAL and GGDEF domain